MVPEPGSDSLLVKNTDSWAPFPEILSQEGGKVLGICILPSSLED